MNNLLTNATPSAAQVAFHWECSLYTTLTRFFKILLYINKDIRPNPCIFDRPEGGEWTRSCRFASPFQREFQRRQQFPTVEISKQTFLSGYVRNIDQVRRLSERWRLEESNDILTSTYFYHCEDRCKVLHHAPFRQMVQDILILCIDRTHNTSAVLHKKLDQFLIVL